MIYSRAPPKKSARKGHFPLDKQLPIVVFFNHDERYKDGEYNDLRILPTQLSTIRNTPERSSPVPLPDLQEDLYRGL
jgi:hypothetical protein